MPRPWYETYPRQYWTAEDLRHARREGYRGPGADQLFEPLSERLPIAPGRLLPPGFGGLRDDRAQGRNRRREADRLLEKVLGRH